VQDGMFLHVAPGTTLPGPIQVLFLSTRSDSGSVVHPRLLVLMGQDAQAHLIETHASLNEGPYFTNVVTEVVLGRGAKLEHSRLQAESPHAYHVASTHVLQQANSTYTSLAIDTGGGLVRNNLIVVLNEQEAHADMNGLYLLKGEQHVDYNTFIDHAVPHTSAKELYKGILDGHAHAIFGGKVLVRNGAFGTESRQINKTLLLSQGAAIDTKPQLEIYADDVKCAHGAAVGQLDTEALFYLKSRGLGDTEARALLTYGFVSEVLHSVSHIPFRAYLDQMVHAQMQRSNELDQ
jgi:Fe-S cluster assembly protein SufD